MPQQTLMSSPGDEIVGRINELGAISETPEQLARIFLTKEHRAAAELITKVRQSVTIDWTLRESARAKIKRARGPVRDE